MSQQYDNKLRGVLFKNDRKTTTNHPDYKGSCETEDGTEYWLSAWIKNGAKGAFLSISMTPKEGQQNAQRATPARSDADDFLTANRATIDKHRPQPQPNRPPAPSPDFDSFDDDIPF